MPMKKKLQKWLILFYRNTESENIITYVPFYGGAKGQTLQITEYADGTVRTEIIKNADVPLDVIEISDSKEIIETQESEINKDIKSIHQTAQNIIRLQNAAKANGQLSEDEQEKYNQQMEQLNLATRNLAQFQEAQQDEDIDNDEMSRSNLRFWFEQKKKKFIGNTNAGNKEEELTNGEGNEEIEEIDDGVAINLPPEDASVAEAKPVGLAVAGVGGVAASKPVATAVVGPAGLAIARPVATAIAGVNPEDAMIPMYADGYIKFPVKRKEKVPNKETNKESNKDNCKGDKCDKGDKKEEKPLEKPKQDYLSAYEMRYFEY